MSRSYACQGHMQVKVRVS